MWIQPDEIGEKYKEERALNSITIELLNQCNWNCMHCYLDRKVFGLDESKIHQIIDEARQLGVYEIKLSGGEITLNPKLNQIIEDVRNHYCRVVLLSNMYKVDDSVFDCVKEYGIDQVETTLFSHKETVHDAFVGVKGALRNTLINLLKMQKLGVSVKVKTWAIKSNIDDLQTMQEYFFSLGFDFEVEVQIYDSLNGVMKLPDKEKLTDLEYRRALHMCDISHHRCFPIEWNNNERLCPEFMNSLYITANGDIVPCAKFKKVLGNIYESSLIDIWNQSKLLHEIQDYTWKDCKGCESCSKKEYCVRCGAMAFIKGKSYLDNCQETCVLAAIREKKYIEGVSNY